MYSITPSLQTRWQPASHPRLGTSKPWPTMYDLPYDKSPEEPGLPDIFHDLQPQLLSETFRPPHYSSDQILVASDLNLYYDITHDHWYKRPDWMAVVGVPWLYDQQDLRFSYVIWDEQVTPFIVVELLSAGTEDSDLGKVPMEPDKTPPKWEVYERILKIPYYAVYSRYTNELQMFQLKRGRYRKQRLTKDKRFFFDDLQLGLGIWEGCYQNTDRHWLRWYDATGQWLPTLMEQVETKEHQRILEQRRADLERQRADVQQRLLETERQRAETERQRAERLAAKLRALGIEAE